MDAQGITGAIDLVGEAAGLTEAQRRALIRPHAVNPAVMHARVFGGAPLAEETVMGSFVDGARVRAGALIALAERIGGADLGAEVNALLVDTRCRWPTKGSPASRRCAPPTRRRSVRWCRSPRRSTTEEEEGRRAGQARRRCCGSRRVSGRENGTARGL